MKLIVTTKVQATVQESWVIEVPDETDHTTDEGFAEIANAFFNALADHESFVRIISSGQDGELDVSEREIACIEGPES